MLLLTRLPILLIIGFALLLSSCSLIAQSNDDQLDEPDADNLETILFSNNIALDTEKKYYNALLDLQDEYPNKINSFQIVFKSENEETIKRYNIQSYPTLIIINKDDILIRIEGAQTQETIFNSIEKVYKK